MSLLMDDLLARAQFYTAPTTVSISGSTARNSSAMGDGMYLLFSTTACFFLQGGSGVNATTSSIPLPANFYFGPVKLDAGGGLYVAAITSGASGTLSIIPVVNNSSAP
jgi:hypothetical protein